MIRKAFAVLLLMLVALPFTAPFSTCDADTLFGNETTALPHHSPAAPSLDEGGHALPLVGSLGRLRLRVAWDLLASDCAGGAATPSVGAVRRAAATRPQLIRTSVVALRI